MSKSRISNNISISNNSKNNTAQFSGLYIYDILADSPCFATVNLYLLRKVKALNFSLLLHYYVNSSKVLNYVHIDICPRRRVHRMPAFKKRKSLPVV